MLRRRIPIFCLILLMLATSRAFAAPNDVGHESEEDARRAQINAAAANAAEKLRDEIAAARVIDELSVEEFLRRTKSSGELNDIVRGAQQIGGPRWTNDEQTCQIKLELSGATVAGRLVEIAHAKRSDSPVRPEELERELRGWRDRSFSATGTSLSAEGAERVGVLRPVRARIWEGVTDEIRAEAVATARRDAARRSLESVRPVELAPGLTVADALARPEVAQRMQRWFETRPIKTVSFKEDLQVDLTLGAPADETFDELFGALAHAQGVKLPQDEQALERARAAFVQRMAEPVGRANLSTSAVQAQPAPVELPPQAPEWVNRQIDAEATATPSGTKPLARVQAAQDKAVQALRGKLGALPLDDGLTLDDAARKDPRIARALDRAMLRARMYKVDYGGDGTVTVRMMIDPRGVWDEVSNGR